MGGVRAGLHLCGQGEGGAGEEALLLRTAPVGRFYCGGLGWGGKEGPAAVLRAFVDQRLLWRTTQVLQ